MSEPWSSSWWGYRDDWTRSERCWEDGPQEKQSWQTTKSWNTAPQNPASCRGWGACGSEEDPNITDNAQKWTTGYAQKWTWADQTKDKDAPSSGMNWTYQNWGAKVTPQASPKAPPEAAQSSNNNKGAPLASQRWLAANHPANTAIQGATARERADAHNETCLLPDVSCRDIGVVSCGDGSLPNNANASDAQVLQSDGYGVEFFRSYAPTNH